MRQPKEQLNRLKSSNYQIVLRGLIWQPFLREFADWNFRVEEKRIIKIKTVNQQMRKAAAVDVKTDLPICN